MRGGLPFLRVYAFGPTHEFVLRTLLLPFHLCFPPAVSLSTAFSFCIYVEVIGEQYYA